MDDIIERVGAAIWQILKKDRQWYISAKTNEMQEAAKAAIVAIADAPLDEEALKLALSIYQQSLPKLRRTSSLKEAIKAYLAALKEATWQIKL